MRTSKVGIWILKDARKQQEDLNRIITRMLSWG
nr:hypothetical protein I308_02343 [Cryptococcus tetragattii IND107]